MIQYNQKAYNIIIEAPINSGNNAIVNGLYNVYFSLKFNPNEILETLNNFYLLNNEIKDLNYIKNLKIHLNHSKYKDNFLIEFFIFS